MRGGLVAVLALGVGAGCQSDVTFQNRSGRDVFQQQATDQVDILWVVDNSNSMSREQDLLARGFTTFISEIEAIGIDFHLGVLTTEFELEGPTASQRGVLIGDPPVIDADMNYVELFQERANVGLDGSRMERGLASAAFALSPQMTVGANAGFLRPTAQLFIVFVSDEEDCSDDGSIRRTDDPRRCYFDDAPLVPVGEFVDRFVDVKGRKDLVRIAAIVGPERAEANEQCDKETFTGGRYLEAVRLTDGFAGSICESDWSDILYALGADAAGLQTSFELSHGAVPGTLRVFVNEREAPESEFDGYTYDAVARAIEFHGDWIPEHGAEIRVEYDIESGT